MKKALIALLALACLSALSYADGVTVGMDFGRSQFILASGSSVANSDILQGWANGTNTTWPNGQRMDIQLAWSSDHAAVNMTGYVMNSSAIDFVNTYGTLKVVPDMAKIMVGRFQGDGFDAFRHDSPHPIHDMNQGNVGRFGGWGIIADVAPKDSGFEAALGIMAPKPDSAIQVPIADAVGNYDFAASYTVPNLVKISAGTTMFNQHVYPVDATPSRAIFAAVDLLAVPNLTLWNEFYYMGIDQNPAPTIFGNELAAQYVADKLTAVIAVLYASNTPNGSSTTASALGVYPEVYYNLGMLTVGIYGGYSMVMLTNVTNNGSVIDVEPYIVLNDFGVRLSFHSTRTTATSS